MNTPVKCRDPRTPAIRLALKLTAKADKITNIRQVGPEQFEGDCLKRLGTGKTAGYAKLGRFSVTMPHLTPNSSHRTRNQKSAAKTSTSFA